MPPRPAPTVRAALLTRAALLLTAPPAVAQQDAPAHTDRARQQRVEQRMNERTDARRQQMRQRREAEMRERMQERRLARRQELQAEIRRNAAPAAGVNEQDSLALVALYNSTDGDNWDANTGWLSAPVADWYGVTVSGDRVVEVSLNGLINDPFGLDGPLPSELGQLGSLEVLSLRNNALSGEIPSELGQLGSLQILNLSYNELTGPIPLSFTNLTAMSDSESGSFYFDGTNLCEPPDAAFQDWLSGIDDLESTGVVCSTSGSLAVDTSQTGLLVLQTSGAALRLTANGDADGGQLQFRRHGERPPSNAFSGSATAPDGSTVAPNTVAPAYWMITGDGLSDVTFRVRLDTTGVPGISDPDQLLILKRADSTEAWTPLNTTRDGSELVSSDLTSFSEFAIGGNSETNPLPVEEGNALPQDVALQPAYPNPFRRGTTIRYGLPQAQDVTLTVFDLLGRRVATLADGRKPAGKHEVRLRANRLPSGVYVYRLRAGSRVETQRMVVVR